MLICCASSSAFSIIRDSLFSSIGCTQTCVLTLPHPPPFVSVISFVVLGILFLFSVCVFLLIFQTYLLSMLRNNLFSTSMVPSSFFCQIARVYFFRYFSQPFPLPTFLLLRGIHSGCRYFSHSSNIFISR